jgi:hypothetical protein
MAGNSSSHVNLFDSFAMPSLLHSVSSNKTHTINERGEIVPKWRLIHDQSFNVIKGTHRSINDRLITDDLTPCRYGKALLRHIHVIIGLRQRHPNLQILQSKVDWKPAYRRLHYAANTAIQSIVLIGSFALIALALHDFWWCCQPEPMEQH